MGARVRGAAYAITILVAIFGFSELAFAQGVDCSKPAAAVSNDWMSQTFDIGGAKHTNTFTITGDQVELKENIGAIWLSYTFKTKDIKSVDEGGNDDGIVGITIVAPFEFANSRGEKTPPAGVTNISMDYPSENADAVLAGLKALQQRAVCGK